MRSATSEWPKLLTLDPEVASAEAQVERTREQLLRSILALKRSVANQSDWREWVRRRPGPLLAVAFALGFILGQRLRRRHAMESR